MSEGAGHAPALHPETLRWRHRREALEQELQAARDRLHSSRRQWTALAGADADPHDLEVVIARNDPQYEVLSGVVDESPAVRATRSFHQQVRGAWTTAWTELGRPVPAASEGPELEAALSQLVSGPSEPLAEHPSRSGSAAGMASPPADPDAGHREPVQAFPTLVLVEPFAGLDASDRRLLEDRLLELGPALQVLIVVSEPLADPPAGPLTA